MSTRFALTNTGCNDASKVNAALNGLDDSITLLTSSVTQNTLAMGGPTQNLINSIVTQASDASAITVNPGKIYLTDADNYIQQASEEIDYVCNAADGYGHCFKAKNETSFLAVSASNGDVLINSNVGNDDSIFYVNSNEVFRLAGADQSLTMYDDNLLKFRDAETYLQSTSSTNLKYHATEHLFFGGSCGTPFANFKIGYSGASLPRIGLRDAGGSYWTYLVSGTQSADLTYTIPTAYPAGNNYALVSSTAGVMSWYAVQPLDSDLTALAAISCARGMIIKGSGLGAWEGLALGGAAGSFLTRGASDPLWSDYYLIGTTGQTYTFSATGGTVPTGSGTQYRVPRWATTSTLGDSPIYLDSGNATVAINVAAAADTILNLKNIVSTPNQYINHVLLSGYDNKAAFGTSAYGIAWTLTCNATNNKQMVINDSELARNGTNPMFRIGIIAGKAGMDSVSTDSTTYLPLYLSENANLAVCTGAAACMRIGNVDPTSAASLGAKLKVYDLYRAPSLTQGSFCTFELTGNLAVSQMTFGNHNASPYYGWIQERGDTNAAYPFWLNPLGGNITLTNAAGTVSIPNLATVGTGVVYATATTGQLGATNIAAGVIPMGSASAGVAASYLTQTSENITALYSGNSMYIKSTTDTAQKNAEFIAEAGTANVQMWQYHTTYTGTIWTGINKAGLSRILTNANSTGLVIDTGSDVPIYLGINGATIETVSSAALYLTGVDFYFVTAGSGLPYGSIYGNEIAWQQASAAQNTWYNISDADMTDGTAGLNLIAHDGSGKLTVTKAGRYLVNYSITLSSSIVNKHILAGIELDGSGTGISDGQCHIEAKFANQEECASGTAVIVLGANGYFEISVCCTDTGTPNIDVSHLCISVSMVGG